MGLFDFLKKKKKPEAIPENGPEELLELGVDPAGIDPPETRYTQEYSDYLHSLEDAEETRSMPEGEAAGSPGEDPGE